MAKTTRDEINLDLDGAIDAAIKKLQRLKKKYPDGRINLTSDYEYGESYPRLKLEFTRAKNKAEIELGKWRDKQSRYSALCSAAAAYKAEGDTYPRAAELKALKDELGAWADAWGGSLTIFDGEVLMWGFEGAQTRDGEWRLKSMGHPDMMKSVSESMNALVSDSDTRPEDGDAKQGPTRE